MTLSDPNEKGQRFDAAGNLYEQYEGEWMRVVNASRDGWWRFHEHYDRQGYCDNPGRGY